ncbi:MAG: hypothetical protein OEM62_10675 [Acidobacteriota bacterium]|nr:hypothetical protein [Acidobacteriota bacterium]
MSTVIWVNRLKDGKVTSDDVDRRALYTFADKLDRLCHELGVTRLSEYHDTTDLEANLAPETDESDEDDDFPDTYELMAEKGKWFPPEQGIEVVDRLLEHLKRKPVRFGLLGDHSEEVMRELEECRAVLERIKADGAKFHFCIVM